LRRSIEDILNNKYSEDYEEERRRKEEQDAEWYRQQLQKFREEQAAQGTRQPAANPIEPPRTDPEKRTDMRNIMDQAMQRTILSRTTGYDVSRLPEVLSFGNAASAARSEITRKNQEQERLRQMAPSLQKELERLQKTEMEWYRQEAEKGNTFGNEGYDRYVTAIDPAGTSEHGKAKKRIDEIKNLLAREANPQSTVVDEDAERMYSDMREIAMLPSEQRSALYAYAMAGAGKSKTLAQGIESAVRASGMKKWDGEMSAAWRDWKNLPEERRKEAVGRLRELGEDKIDQLAESLTRYYDQEKSLATQEKASNATEKNAWGTIGANLLSIPQNIVGSVTGAASAINESIRRSTSGSNYNTMNPNLPGYNPSKWAGTVREETQNDIQEAVPGVGGKALGTLYSAGMSAADNLARVGLTGGAGSLTLAGLGSFQSGVQEASERGASPSQAVAMGVASGALEVLTEKVSLDRLLNADDPSTIKELLKNAAIQGGVEVSEEELSLAGNLLAEAVILQKNSKSNQARQAYIAAGMTLEEANAAVLNDNIKEAASTAAVSFLSGGMMSAGVGAKGLLTSRRGSSNSGDPENPPAEPRNEAESPSPKSNEEALNQAMRDTFRPAASAGPTQETINGTVDNTEFGEYNSVASDPSAAFGSSGKTYGEDNSEIGYRWAVVPADSLVTSHDEFGAANAAYPSDLQPRDRSRAASQLQVSKIAKNLTPALLAESPTAQNGAPIVRGDGVVIGGNARAQAISTAYKNGSANEYAEYVRSHAQEYGLDPQRLPDNPVLIRIPTGDVDWSRLASSLNNSTTSSYSAAETALNDSKNMGEVIPMLSVDESGDLNAKGNKQFISAFVEKVVPESDRARVVTSNGTLSQEGLSRVQNAIFSYAYGDEELLTRLTESLGNDAKNVTNALLAVAPQVARARESVASGSQYDVNLPDAVIGAVQLFLRAKNEGTTPDNIADQVTIGDGYSSSEVLIANFIQANKRSGAQIRTMLSCIFDELQSLGSPDQDSLFEEPTTIRTVLEGGIKRYESETGRAAGTFDGTYDERRGHDAPAASSRKRQTGGVPVNDDNSEGAGAVYGSNVRSGLGGLSAKNKDASTGAAPRGFDPYTSLQYESGNKPDRRNDARPMNVPKRDGNGKRVSDFVANAYGAKVTPDSFIPVIEKMVTDGIVGADTKTNRDTLQNAAKEVSSGGEEAMMWRISKAAETGEIGETEIAAAQLLYSKYANSKDQKSQETAAKLFVDMTDMARVAGRALQLHKMLRQMTPEGQLSAVKENINRYYQKKFGKKIAEGSMPETIQIPDSLSQEYLQELSGSSKSREVSAANAVGNNMADASDAGKIDALSAIYEYAAAQMPGTLDEKFDSWRYMSMLGNVKTHVRNVIGNAAFRPYVDVKRAIGSALERALPKEQRTKSVIGLGKKSRELLSWAKSDAKSKTVSEMMEYSGKSGDSAKSEIQKYRKIFKNEALNKLSNANSNALEAEDLFFKRSAYASSLAGFIKARGYSSSEVLDGKVPDQILQEARSYAVNEAMKATFNDLNAFSKAVSQFGRKKSENRVMEAAKKVFFEGVLPFRKTPANIVVRSVEYSPFGLVRAGYQYFSKVRDGEMTAAECMETLSAGLTGTGVYALGALLGSLGVVRGGELGDDEDRTGHQAYELVLGDTSVSLDWLAPAAIPFFMGVETQKAASGEYGDDTSAVTAIIYGAGNAMEPLLELSCLSSLNDLISSARYTDDGNEIWSLIISSATSYLMQALPTAFGQFDQAADKNRKTVYTTSSDPVVKELQRIAGRAFQKLPGDFFQVEYVDEWGRKEGKGNFFQRVFNAFLNPAYTSKINETQADQELYRLAATTGDSPSPRDANRTITIKTPDGAKKVALTAEEWRTLAEKQGSVSYDLVSKMLGQEAYEGLTDEGKKKAIESAYDYAREIGRKEALPDRYKEMDAAWMEDLGGDIGDKAVSAILKRAAVSDVGAPSEKTYDRAVEAGFSTEQMKAAFRAVSSKIKGVEDPTNYDKYRAVLSVSEKNDEKSWLKVYGMTENQLAEMDELKLTPAQYVDILDSKSRFSSALEDVTQAWKQGESPDPKQLEDAYDFYKSLKGGKTEAYNNLTSAAKAYIAVRQSGEDSGLFLRVYRTYRYISAQDKPAAEKALDWNYNLDKVGVPNGLKSSLLSTLGFTTTLRQDSGKYGELTGSGLEADKAKKVADLMRGLTPEDGKDSVSNVQKMEAIHGMGMTPEQEELTIRTYLPDSMEKGLNKAIDIGISAGEWVELYREYARNKGTGKGQKDRLTRWCMEEFGVDYATARALADIYL
jgi:hypothetical protein